MTAPREIDQLREAMLLYPEKWWSLAEIKEFLEKSHQHRFENIPRDLRRLTTRAFGRYRLEQKHRQYPNVHLYRLLHPAVKEGEQLNLL
jgi:hypothetical protein